MIVLNKGDLPFYVTLMFDLCQLKFYYLWKDIFLEDLLTFLTDTVSERISNYFLILFYILLIFGSSSGNIPVIVFLSWQILDRV